MPACSLRYVADKLVLALPADARNTIQSKLAALSHDPMLFSTACSGSEVAVKAWAAVEVASLHTRGDKTLRHRFSCEINPPVRAFIKDNFHPERVFEDVAELNALHSYDEMGASR